MRPLALGERDLWLRTGKRFFRAEVKRPTETAWTNLSDVAGGDWVLAVRTSGEKPDQPATQFTFSLLKHDGAESLSPGMTNAPLNRVPSGMTTVFSPLIHPGRDVRIMVAVTSGAAPAATDWKLWLIGQIEDVAWSGDAVEAVCFTPDGQLDQRWIKEEEKRGGAHPGTPVADEIQGLVNRWMDAPPTLVVEGTPGYGVGSYKTPIGSLGQHVRELAKRRGWDLRYKYDAASDSYKLTLYNPPRDKTAVDLTFAADEVFAVESLQETRQYVRNDFRYTYTASNGSRGVVTLLDQWSVDEYGRKALVIVESDASAVDTDVEADDVLQMARKDLSRPVADGRYRIPFFPPLELHDMVSIPPDDDTYDIAQTVAVTSVDHVVEGDGGAYTMFSIRGAGPVGQVFGWINRGSTFPPATGGPIGFSVLAHEWLPIGGGKAHLQFSVQVPVEVEQVRVQYDRSPYGNPSGTPRKALDYTEPVGSPRDSFLIREDNATFTPAEWEPYTDFSAFTITPLDGTGTPLGSSVEVLPEGLESTGAVGARVAVGTVTKQGASVSLDASEFALGTSLNPALSLKAVPAAKISGDLPWTQVSGKPETATRWPAWTEVTSKPATFPPSAHDLDGAAHSGVLGIAKGGTGANFGTAVSGVIVGVGTSTMQSSLGTDGQALIARPGTAGKVAWETLAVVPDATGAANHFLQRNGTGGTKWSSWAIPNAMAPAAGKWSLNIDSAGALAWGALSASDVGAAPASHAHAWADITSGVPVYATRWPTASEAGAVPSTGGAFSGTVTVADHLGIGTTDIEAWSSDRRAMQLGRASAFDSRITTGVPWLNIAVNAYHSTSESYKQAGVATRYTQYDGQHLFLVAPSGTADTAISWTTALTIRNNATIEASSGITAASFFKSSHRKKKREITDWGYDREGLMALRPRQWTRRSDGEWDAGFVTDEVASCFATPDLEALIPDRITTQLVFAAQDHEARIAALEAAL